MAIDTVAPRGRLVLAQSKWLRLVTLFLFYLTQGAPIGVFIYAIPTWMAGNGASAADTAWVVGIAMLPWSLKLVNGFLIDRYAYLPMGRRRAWIIGAQLVLASALLSGALLAPAPDDLVLLATIGFCANMAVTFQDVGIDSLAVDIMEEDERAKASSIMFGAQVLGIAATTAMVGFLLEYVGFSTAMIAAALVPACVAIYGMAISEREGERLLPWSKGTSHPRNVELQIEEWWPLLKQSFRALSMPLSLLVLPILLMRAVPFGAAESFHPVLATQMAGWSITEYTGLISSAQFASGVAGLLIGGWIVERLGAQRSVVMYALIGITVFIGMGLNQDSWTNDSFLISVFVTYEFLVTFMAIAVIPICMRLCSPAVAATQFTVFMAFANFGRPIGAWISGITAGAGSPALLYFVVAGTWILLLAIAIVARFPKENRTEILVAEELPQGDGIPARVN
jgi:PAT family beta-lactamase induction signal transducer AmpG